MIHQLTPPSLEARARSRKYLPFGVGKRALLMAAIGCIWIIPAWWISQLIGVLLIWDVILVIVWVVDLLRLPPSPTITVERAFSGPLALGRVAQIKITVRAGGLSFVATDHAPTSVREEPPLIDGSNGHYDVTPRVRGTVTFGDVFIRCRSAIGFAERWCAAPLQQSVTVYPDLVQAKEAALYLIRSRQQEMQKRTRRTRGMGREFESLRDYWPGDDIRDISWTATARRNQLVTRTYTAERSQTIWLVIDAGRLMRAQVQGPSACLTKLDHGVNAALGLAHVASQNGDRVGLLAYGRGVQAAVAPARGSGQIRCLIDALANVRPEQVEADHGHAAKILLQKQARRALIVWITDFAETPALPDVIEYAVHASRRHLVLFSAISQPDLAEVAHSVPDSEIEMFRQAAALEIVDRRELMLRRLRQTGVMVMEVNPDQFAGELVNQYLEIKDRGLL